MSNNEHDDLFNDVLNEDIDALEGAEKLASAGDPIGYTPEELQKIASFYMEGGKLMAIGFRKQLRQDAAEFLKAAGLTNEQIENAKTAGLNSSPITQAMSEAIKFIISKIHPVTMLENYNLAEPAQNAKSPESVVSTSQIATRGGEQSISDPINPLYKKVGK